MQSVIPVENKLDDDLYLFKLTFNQKIPSMLSAVLKNPKSHAFYCGEHRLGWNERGHGKSALKSPEDKPWY